MVSAALRLTPWLQCTSTHPPPVRAACSKVGSDTLIAEHGLVAEQTRKQKRKNGGRRPAARQLLASFGVGTHPADERAACQTACQTNRGAVRSEDGTAAVFAVVPRDCAPSSSVARCIAKARLLPRLLLLPCCVRAAAGCSRSSSQLPGSAARFCRGQRWWMQECKH